MAEAVADILAAADMPAPRMSGEAAPGALAVPEALAPGALAAPGASGVPALHAREPEPVLGGRSNSPATAPTDGADAMGIGAVASAAVSVPALPPAPWWAARPTGMAMAAIPTMAMVTATTRT